MNEQTHTTEETVSNEEIIEEVGKNGNAEQTQSEESGKTSGETKSEQVNFEQMYDMLKERDATIENQNKEISELKKANTELLLKVNAASGTTPLKTPFESFVDLMNGR